MQLKLIKLIYLSNSKLIMLEQKCNFAKQTESDGIILRV